MRDFLAITGATTTGKTALSVEVAEALDGEIVSMDSRQIYRGMDIATDKIRPPLLGRVPHHGLDIRRPDERYSAGHYARDARGWISDIRSRDRVPVLVGGTGFFLKALIEPIFAEPVLDPKRREALERYFSTLSSDRLAVWTDALDPERADLAREGGRQRLTRTLEVALLSGRSLSWWHAHGEPEAAPLAGLVVVLEVDRGELDRRIHARVERMVSDGLLDEVRSLVAAGFDADDPGMSGTGYRELSAHLRGEMALEEALEAMRSQTRRYARRQLTWFRHQLPEDAVRLDGMRPRDELIREIVGEWRSKRAKPAGGSVER